MRLASYEHQGRPSFGVVREAAIVDLQAPLSGRYGSVLDIVRAGAFEEVAAEAARRPADLPLDSVRLLPPVLGGEKILCVGVNYANRNAEYRDNTALPSYPSLFFRVPGSFVGHDSPLVRPRQSAQLDYEGEIVLVIGRDGRHIGTDEALDHICGLTLCNEGTIRDWVRHAKFNVTQGKNFDSSGSIGPWMVTVDEVNLHRPMRLVTRVNGEIRQDDTTSNMIFSFADLIAYISSFMTLKAGDIIVTGTPTGAGARAEPPQWLKPGDTIEVETPGLGVLRNGVRDEG